MILTNNDGIVVDAKCTNIYELQLTVILNISYNLEQLNSCYKIYCTVELHSFINCNNHCCIQYQL